MKKSVIKGIFKGDRGHVETMHKPQKEYGHLKFVCEPYDELKEKLSPELFKLLEKYTNALESNWSEEVDFFFVEGFKLGLLIGIECMEE